MVSVAILEISSDHLPRGSAQPGLSRRRKALRDEGGLGNEFAESSEGSGQTNEMAEERNCFVSIHGAAGPLDGAD